MAENFSPDQGLKLSPRQVLEQCREKLCCLKELMELEQHHDGPHLCCLPRNWSSAGGSALRQSSLGMLSWHVRCADHSYELCCLPHVLAALTAMIVPGILLGRRECTCCSCE